MSPIVSFDRGQARFDPPYLYCKKSHSYQCQYPQNTRKHATLKCKIQKFSGEGVVPLPSPHPQWGGVWGGETPSPCCTIPPSRLRRSPPPSSMFWIRQCSLEVRTSVQSATFIAHIKICMMHQQQKIQTNKLEGTELHLLTKLQRTQVKIMTG